MGRPRKVEMVPCLDPSDLFLDRHLFYNYSLNCTFLNVCHMSPFFKRYKRIYDVLTFADVSGGRGQREEAFP